MSSPEIESQYSQLLDKILNLNSECLELSNQFESKVKLISENKVQYFSTSKVSLSRPSKQKQVFLLLSISNEEELELESLKDSIFEFHNLFNTSFPNYFYKDMSEELRVYKFLDEVKCFEVLKGVHESLLSIRKILQQRLNQVIKKCEWSYKVSQIIENKNETYFKVKETTFSKSLKFCTEITISDDNSVSFFEDFYRSVIEKFMVKMDESEVKLFQNEERRFKKKTLPLLSFLTSSESSIIIKELSEKKILYEWLQESTLMKVNTDELLFRGTRDGFGSEEFHSRCDNRGPTLVVAITRDGCVFGGYTPLSWSSSDQSCVDTRGSGFIFCMRTKKKYSCRKLGVGIFSSPSYGPTFGETPDGAAELLISSYCNQRDSSFSLPNGSYSLPQDEPLCGKEDFFVDNYEVWRVSPLESNTT